MKKRPIHLAEEEKRARQREDARRRKLLFLAHVRTEQERLEAERCAEEERLALENAERERLEAERRAEEERLLDRAEDEEVWAELPRDAAPVLRAAVAATALDRDAACKQLLVANRAELYHIFKCYMDRLTKAASRPTLQLFAVHFGFVPTHFTRRALNELLDHLVAAVNARKAARARARARRPSRATGVQMANGDEAPLDSNTCPLSYINFLSLLVLMAHFGRDGDRNESLAESLSRLLTFMDNSDGKSKMGGTSKRNSYSSGRMAYLDSPKLPDKEAALNFGIYRWYCDTHAQQWKGGSPSNKEALQFRTKSSPSIIRRSSLSVFGSERSLSSAASKSTRSPVSPAPTANHSSSFQGIKARKDPVDLHKLQRAGSDGSLTAAPCSDIIWEISHTSSKRNAAPGKGQNSNGGKQLQPEVGADNTS
uniref:Uncharacterized protein n=2 Tax=Heterosigma akashiwo TaxID=2829 RepID=A0A7S3XMV8_HETAK